MVTRIHGTFDIFPAKAQTLRQLDGSTVPPPNGDFHTVVDGRTPENYPQSSTTWLVYARDVRDDTNNVIRLEPRYLRDSPPLVPNMGLNENVFRASPEDPLQGDVLCYYPGDYQESPYEWSEAELDREVGRHLRDFAGRASNMDGHFLETKDPMAALEGDDAHACVCFGEFNSRDVWSVLLIVASEDPLSLDRSSKAAKKYHIRNQGPTVMDDGRDEGLALRCSECSEEQLHVKVNYRNRRGRYVEEVFECQGCGNLLDR